MRSLNFNDFFFFLFKFTYSFQRPEELGFALRLTEMSIRSRNTSFWEAEIGWAAKLITSSPSVSRLSRQSEILNITKTYWTPRPDTVRGYSYLIGNIAKGLHDLLRG
jgi:hypothetical protein